MPRAFLLTWNPSRWEWSEDEYADSISTTQNGGVSEGRWSVGSRRGGINAGDRAFLVRQHSDRGIVAAGAFTAGVRREPHWEDPERWAWYADVEWEVVLATEDRLRVELLKEEVPEVPWDSLRGSGVLVPEDAHETLAELLEDHLSTLEFRAPEEVLPSDPVTEGTVSTVVVNRYERNHRARQLCIQHWGTSCAVCGFDFGSRYGKLGQGYIHVHHLVDLATVGGQYEVDPIKDLRPVCPNCHAMLHQRSPALSIKALKSRLRPSS